MGLFDFFKEEKVQQGFTLENLERIKIGMSELKIKAMFGEPGFQMPAEAGFAMFGFVPESEKGKVHWVYNTPYGEFQVIVKNNLVVGTFILESLIEKMKTE